MYRSINLTEFDSENKSNLIIYRSSSTINISNNYIIPSGVKVIFDAPNVNISPEFYCPIGASFEIKQTGC